MLSPVSLKFASLIHSNVTIAEYVGKAVLIPHQDILQQSRLSLMTISQAPGFFTNSTDYRLYDSLSNSFFDCSVRHGTDVTGAVTKRYVNAVKVSHNGYNCAREFDYNNCLSILPLLEVFEEKVVKSYYEKHKDYLPMIEALTIPAKNFFVGTMKKILSGETVSPHFKEEIQELQRKYDATSLFVRTDIGSLKKFLDYEYHRVRGVVVLSDTLHDMFSDFTGFNFQIFTKEDSKELQVHLNAINSAAPDGKVFITEQEHQEFMNPVSISTEHISSILTKINTRINEMCSDMTEEQLRKLKNRLHVNMSGYANKVFQYIAYTQADKFQPNKEIIVEQMSRVKIFENCHAEPKAQSPRTIHNALYESGLHHYLMS